ncbi:MAG: hypothetical protein ACRDTU_20080 [Micromonosporaceae bacterium]
MLFALLQPAALAGLLLAFGLGLAVRVSVQVWLAARLLRHRVGSALPQPRRDIDPFGAIAAVLGGTGWGREAPLPESGWLVGQVRQRATVLIAGPLAVIVLGMLVLFGHRYGFGGGQMLSGYPSDVLRGSPGPPLEQVVVSFGVGLLCFGVLAFVPLPPLDGWGLLWLAFRRPGETAQKVQFWLGERNLGMLALLVLLIYPINTPLVHRLLDLLVHPLISLAAS